MPTIEQAAVLEVENLSWPRYWAVDIYTDEPNKTPTITTGKLLIQLKHKEDLKLQYLCMCGASFVRVMGVRTEELEAWVAAHRTHNHLSILNLIAERLRTKVVKEHPEQ